MISGHDAAVIEAIAQGKSLEEAGVSPAFLLRVGNVPGLSVALKVARELSSYALEEEALGRLRAAVTAGTMTNTQLRALDLLVTQLRWSSIKRNPNVFSEKAAVNVTVPIQINTSLDLGAGEVGSGTKEFPNIYEATAVIRQEIPLEDVGTHPSLLSSEEVVYASRAAYAAETAATTGEAAAEETERLRGFDEMESLPQSREVERVGTSEDYKVPRKARKPRKVQRVPKALHAGETGQIESRA